MADGQAVETGDREPEVQVTAKGALGCVADRLAGGEGDVGVFGEFDGDLARGKS
jgi:hypothetical protein